MSLALVGAFGVGAVACPPEPESAGGEPKAPAGRIANPALSGLRLDPTHPAWKAYIEQQRKAKAAEKELRKIRYQHFVAKQDVENRRLGMEKIRAFTDPAVFPTLLAVFADDAPEVRRGILDHLAAQKSDEADAALAWETVFAKKSDARSDAQERLLARMKGLDAIPRGVQSVIAEGLGTSNHTVLGAAGGLAQSLKIWEAIPMMINGQIQGVRDDADPNSVLAYILIGQQRSYVADLNPIVGDNAVAFDPVPGVITEGTVLKVQNAVVTEYITELHRALVGLTTQGWGGRSTEHLGYDRAAWTKWYNEEFLPYRAKMDGTLKVFGTPPLPPTTDKPAEQHGSAKANADANASASPGGQTSSNTTANTSPDGSSASATATANASSSSSGSKSGRSNQGGSSRQSSSRSGSSSGQPGGPGRP